MGTCQQQKTESTLLHSKGNEYIPHAALAKTDTIDTGINCY